MQAGDLVIYLEGGKEFYALVLGVRQHSVSYRVHDSGSGQFVSKTHDHSGANGEPLLSLVFVKQRVDAFGNPLPIHGTGQSSEAVSIRDDVAHESHSYDDEQKAHFGKNAYDGGRWREHRPLLIGEPEEQAQQEQE